MSRRTLARLALACGAALLLLLVAGALGGGPGAAQAQTLPPRPGTPVPEEEEDRRATPAPPGRITGTVIDQRTGAPVPGVTVAVGEAVVTSDANGNYDRNGLEAGSYGVALRLADGQGQSAQGEVAVALGAGETVVQHLFFRSPDPAPAAAPQPAPQPAPTPATLPATGAADPGLLAPALVALLTLGAGLAARRAARR